MLTCRIEVEVCVGNGNDLRVASYRVWPECNIYDTGHTVAWAIRQFRGFLRKADRDEIVTAEWVSIYPDSMHRPRGYGRLSGVNSKDDVCSGIFEGIFEVYPHLRRNRAVR